MVLVGIKTEIGKPKPTVPDEGYLEFFVDWYVKLLTDLRKKKHFHNLDLLEQKRVHLLFELLVLKFQIHIPERCMVESYSQVHLLFM